MEISPSIITTIESIGTMARNSRYLPGRIAVVKRDIVEFEKSVDIAEDREAIFLAALDLEESNADLYSCGAIMALGREGMEASYVLYNGIDGMIKAECFRAGISFR